MPPRYVLVKLKMNKRQGGQLRMHGMTRLHAGPKGGQSPVFITPSQLRSLRASRHRGVVLRMSPAQHRYNLKFGGGVWTERGKRALKALIPAFRNDILALSDRLGSRVGSRLDRYGLGNLARKGIRRGTEHLLRRVGGGVRRRYSRSRSRSRKRSRKGGAIRKTRRAASRARVSKRRRRTGMGLYL